MNSFLRQSTASQSRALGPFLDDTDFKTPETGLTIANTDIKIVVNGAASVNKNSGGGTHRVNGEYGVTWDATDTATVGEMKVSVYVAGALIVFATYTVLEEAQYDALFGTKLLSLDGSGNVVMSLANLNISAASGPAVSIAAPSGATAAVYVTAGAGIEGLRIVGGTDADGVRIHGGGDGVGLQVRGGPTGKGVEFRGGSTSGTGVEISAANGLGLQVIGGGSVNSGVELVAGAGPGLSILGATGQPAAYLLGGSGASVLDLDPQGAGTPLNLATVEQIADAYLKRDWTAVSGEAARSALNAMRLLRNHWEIASGILTVTKENDSTTAWTSVLTGAPGADPVSGSDPT